VLLLAALGACSDAAAPGNPERNPIYILEGCDQSCVTNGGSSSSSALDIR
jgi:hypothetical protein